MLERLLLLLLKFLYHGGRSIAVLTLKRGTLLLDKLLLNCE